MAAGTETVRTVRPAFEAFYDTLDEGQRRKIEVTEQRVTAWAIAEGSHPEVLA